MKGVSRIKQYLFAVLFALVLTAFTVYALLDVFVIEHSYDTVPVTDGTDDDTASNRAPSSPAADRDDKNDSGTRLGSYSEDGVTVTVKQYRIEDTEVYVADITLSSLASLRTAFAESTYGRNIKESTSEIARKHDAILAINGDFYGARVDGYVVRDSVIYRDKPGRYEDGLAIMKDGTFRIFQDVDISAEELVADGARDVFAFGPGLLEDGKLLVDRNSEVMYSMSSNPRTAIAVIEPLHYLFVVSDGRTKESEGLSLYALASFLQSLGADTAYNLDGGGSATMVFQGEVINKPTHNGKTIEEREVSDIVYIR